MKTEYDFSKMKSQKNPYASKLKKSVTIRLGEDVIEYFKEMADETGIQAKHANRLRLILGRLNASTSPADMDLPGLYLHQLTGDRKETWSVRVSGDWRVTFRFNGVHAEVVDYEDHH